MAQAKQVKGEQEASASAQESVKAEQEGQADNVATPMQEQLPNQQVCDVLVRSSGSFVTQVNGFPHSMLLMQEVTMKMSQEDLASLKDAIRKQKSGGGGTDDSGFVEASPPQCI